MPSPDYVIRQGDFGQAIIATAESSAGAAVLITGATVDFVAKPISGGSAIVDTGANNLDVGSNSTRGQMSYTWQDGDTDDPGLYLGSWKVTYTTGEVQTFPNDGYLLIYVSPA